MDLWYVRSTNIGNWWNGNFNIRIDSYGCLEMKRQIESPDSQVAIKIFDHRPASVRAYLNFKALGYDPSDHKPRNAAIQAIKEAMNQAAEVRIEARERSIMIGLHPLPRGFKTKRYLHYVPFWPREVEFTHFNPKWYWTGIEIAPQLTVFMFTVTSPTRDVTYEHWQETFDTDTDREGEYREFGVIEHYCIQLKAAESEELLEKYRY